MNWISVKDKLPEKNQKVMTCLKVLSRDNEFFNIILLGYYSYNSKDPDYTWSIEDCELYPNHQGYEITHWMQLPNFPEELK